MPSDRNLAEARNAIFGAMSRYSNDANEMAHPVESQWHYPTMTQAGFIPETKVATGLVRSYKYNHPDGRSVTYNVGVNADHWTSNDGHGGYWTKLAKYLEQ